jgi:hypothetical protein
MTSYLDMATVKENGICLLCFFKTKSVIETHFYYRIQYKKDPPSANAVTSGDGCSVMKHRFTYQGG